MPINEYGLYNWDESSLYEDVIKKLKIVYNAGFDDRNWNTNKFQVDYKPLPGHTWIDDYKFPPYNAFDRGLCSTEHMADALQTDYIDGVFVTYCKACRAKIVFETFPGQLPKIKIKAILADLMIGETLDLEVLSEVQGYLEKERELLEQAEGQLRLITAMIRSRYEDRIPSAEQPTEHQRDELDALGGQETEIRSLA